MNGQLQLHSAFSTLHSLFDVRSATRGSIHHARTYRLRTTRRLAERRVRGYSSQSTSLVDCWREYSMGLLQPSTRKQLMITLRFGRGVV